MKFEIFKQTSERFDDKVEYRWRLKANNGRIIACSGEGYKSKKHCEKMLSKIGIMYFTGYTVTDKTISSVTRKD